MNIHPTNTIISGNGIRRIRDRWIAHITLIGGFLLIATNTAIRAQETALEEVLPAFRDQAVVLDIVARVVEADQEEVWNSVNSKVTIPGRPVGIKLVGANIVIMVQFTPYRQANGRNVLVAQGQIWVDVPNQGISYQTTMETIVLEYGEPVYFFPLGSIRSPDRARIEIQVELRPYVAAEPHPPEPADGSALSRETESRR
ncbi:hypothetical protein FACS189483_05640 [Spirochaetia bacterium]|nr:hypothetical protein FACS189483_05640 [Spirochaetia bacterium]